MTDAEWVAQLTAEKGTGPCEESGRGWGHGPKFGQGPSDRCVHCRERTHRRRLVGHGGHMWPTGPAVCERHPIAARTCEDGEGFNDPEVDSRGRPKRFHIVSDDGWAACGQPALLDHEDETLAHDVPTATRCRSRACTNGFALADDTERERKAAHLDHLRQWAASQGGQQ